MAIKLRLVLQGPLSALVLKVLIFAGFLLLTAIANFGFISIAFFLIAALVLYGSPPARGSRYFFSFLALISLAIFLLPLLKSPVLGGLFLLAAALIFYIILGLKNLFLVYRQTWNYLLILGLFYLVFILFFLTDKSSHFITQLIILFGAGFLLFKEVFANSENEGGFNGNPGLIRACAGVAGLMVVECAWAISLLPIGLLNSANLAILFTFVLLDILYRNYLGDLSRKVALADLTIFVLIGILIFATSKLSI